MIDMSKEVKSRVWQIGVTLLAIILTAVITRTNGNVDQVRENKQTNAVQNQRLEKVEKQIDNVVTKEYFDMAIENLKDYIDK